MSRLNNAIATCLLAAFVVPTLTGCGTSAGAPPEPVYPVSGVITLNGKPLVGADVTYLNQEKQRAAFGRTNEEGRYQLTTFTQNDGAVEGKSVVTVMKFEAAAPSAPEPELDSEDYQPPGLGEDTGPQKISSDIPKQYADAATSGLFANVLTSGDNQFDFELE